MKFHFEPDLDYQKVAIKSVCDLFRSQEICRTEFTVTRDSAFADDVAKTNLTKILEQNGIQNVRSI